jgi:hypothetical protein
MALLNLVVPSILRIVRQGEPDRIVLLEQMTLIG